MSKSRSVSVRTYRAHRFEIRDDGGLGWIVTIYPQVQRGAGSAQVSGVRLRNKVPNGLETLIEEARRHVDRALDGPIWGASP